MKKLNIIAALFCLVMISGQKIHYGLTGNFHKTSVVGVHDYSKGIFGGSVGAFVDITLIEGDISDEAWLLLMPQIEYHMGGEIARAEEEKFGVQKYHYDYVAMQLYFKYFFHKGGMKQNLFLFLGPRIEYMVRNDTKVDPNYNLAYYQYNLDETVNKIGFGASVGVGLKLSDKVEAFLRYDRGFSKVYPDNNLRNNYNQMLGIGINYYLSQGRW